jgi:ABC-type uncharacterized transport system permease subunit
MSHAFLHFPKKMDTSITAATPALFIICGLAVSAASILGSYAAFKNWRLSLILDIYAAVMFISIMIIFLIILFAINKKDYLVENTKKFYEFILYPMRIYDKEGAQIDQKAKIAFEAYVGFHKYVLYFLFKLQHFPR